MPLFTQAQEQEYADLINEAEEVTTDAPTRRMYYRTIWTMRTLYEMDPYWIQQMPTCITTLKDTWIMEVVNQLGGLDDCNGWLNAKHQAENFQHPEKTENRMAELANVSGTARIMFNSTVDKDWVHPYLKAYWFTLAWAQHDGEQFESTILPSGHHVSVFPF